MALLVRRSFPVCTSCRRAFATSARRHNQLQLSDDIPPYPYGAAQWYKQSDRGLYHGQRIHFGNNVGEKSKTKTRRSWQINVHRKRLFSKAMNRFIQLKVSRKALRTIEKVGGLDEYLLGETEDRIKGLGLKGWELRWSIMQTNTVKRRFREQREALGIDAVQEEVDRLEMEKATNEQNIVLGSDAPVELEVDEPVETLDAQAADGVETAGDPSEDPAWEDIQESVDTARSETGLDATMPAHYPRIRVEKGRTMVLTSKGWQKSIPREKKSKAPTLSTVLKAHLKPQVKSAWEVLQAHNTALQEEGQKALSRKERLIVLRKAKDALKAELESSKEVQRDFDLQVRDLERRNRKKEKNLVNKMEEAAKVRAEKLVAAKDVI